MPAWAGRRMAVLLRVVLTTLLAVLALEVGSRFAPKLARTGLWRACRAAQPDWGGGRLKSEVAERQSPSATRRADGDYALTLPLRPAGGAGRTVRFELPSSSRFRKQLLPEAGDAEPPAQDIPLYPGALCRTQVGHGTACFVGFYLTADSIEAVRSFYVEALGRLGWERVTADRGGTPRGGSPQGQLETFAKSEEARTVVVQLRHQEPALTRVGLVAMAEGR